MAAKNYRGTKEYAIVYAELITAAKYRGTVTYQEIARLLGLPMQGSYMGSVIGRILGAISEDELAHGRPMLSAIAIGVKGGPGPGFFGWARKLARLTTEDEQIFWKSECEAIYDIWKVKLPAK